MAIEDPVWGTPALNNSAAVNLAVSYPSGIQAGDLLVMPVGVNLATQAGAPTGWSASGVGSSAGGSAPSERILLKVATGSESGQAVITHASATSRAIMGRVRGVDTSAFLEDVSSTASATATNTYSLPALDLSVAGCLLVMIGVANAPGGTWTTPTNWTEALETTGAIPSTGVQWRIWPTAGNTGAINYGRSTSVRGCAGVLALRPAPTGPVATWWDGSTEVPVTGQTWWDGSAEQPATADWHA